MNLFETAHQSFISGRRAVVLAERLAELVPRNSSVLDVGCGDGEIAWLLSHRRRDLRISGVDVLVRDDKRVPVEAFDGCTLPYADDSFDVVSFIDVLHHCQEPLELLREARRVARRAILIKDHALQGVAAEPTLRFMDGVGNRRYGVSLPFNYWTPDEWTEAFAALELTVEQRLQRLRLYPWPLTLAFDRRLHFVARLRLPGAGEVDDAAELLQCAGAF